MKLQSIWAVIRSETKTIMKQNFINFIILLIL